MCLLPLVSISYNLHQVNPVPLLHVIEEGGRVSSEWDGGAVKAVGQR